MHLLACGECCRGSSSIVIEFQCTGAKALEPTRVGELTVLLPASQLLATRRRLYRNLLLSEERDPFSCAGAYRIASLFPGAAAFATSLSSRTPLSYAATDADSSSSAGRVKLR